MIKYILSFIPLIGTSIGSILGVCNKRFKKGEETLVAVATGVLCSVTYNLLWETLENIRYISLFIGFAIGIVFIWVMNTIAYKKQLNVRTKLFWAMLIHNIPEGIVVGITLANKAIAPTTLALIISISMQNIPDGLVVSMPLVPNRGRKRALYFGILSGVVEPIASILIMITAGKLSNIQIFEPFLIGFSFSAILMIAIELLRECKKTKKLVLITAVIAVIFNSILQ